MKRLILIIAICWGASAFAATCEPGYYGDTCAQCTSGYYCPGDGERYQCPADTTDWAAHFTEMGLILTSEIPESIVYSWDTAPGTSGGPANTIYECYVDIPDMTTPKGTFLIESRYNGVDYWRNDAFHWHFANDGYYLSKYKFTTYKAWYLDAKACTNAPANAHYTGPGTPDAPDGSVVDANDCPWACDAGFGRSASGQCLPLCTGGVTVIRANSVSVPLFNEKHTSPALAVEYAGQVCYADLVPGPARPAINIDYNGQVYHTVNQ